jgi:methylamine--corrinoid protein Co-methyltransferase
MLTYQEVIRRALNGPISTEKDFDLKRFVPAVRRAVKKYDIKYNPETPVPWDDDLADRVWQAGKDLIVETGVFCVDSERIIEFSRVELEQALKDAPKDVVVGEGHDARLVPVRRPESDTPPFCSLGAAGCPVDSEEVLLSLMQAYAELPYTDAIPTPSLTRVNGRAIVAGSPLEIEGCIRNVKIAKEATRRAGRPGLCIANMVATGVRAAGHIAGHTMGAGKGDMMEIGAFAEMKTDFDIMSKVGYMKSAGCPILGETGPVLGGYCGGPEGTAVTLAAYHFFALLVLRASLHHPFCVHFAIQTSTPREVLWARAMANQAITRNSDVPCLNVGIITAGPATGMSLYETAAYVAATVASGGSIEATGAAQSTHPDYLSPMEPLFAGEVGHAVAGMPRPDVNDIVLKLLQKYEDKLNAPPLGIKYQDCFDIASRRPGKEALEFYSQAREELAGWGIEFKNEPFYQ